MMLSQFCFSHWLGLTCKLQGIVNLFFLKGHALEALPFAKVLVTIKVALSWLGYVGWIDSTADLSKLNPCDKCNSAIAVELSVPWRRLISVAIWRAFSCLAASWALDALVWLSQFAVAATRAESHFWRMFQCLAYLKRFEMNINVSQWNCFMFRIHWIHLWFSIISIHFMYFPIHKFQLSFQPKHFISTTFQLFRCETARNASGPRTNTEQQLMDIARSSSGAVCSKSDLVTSCHFYWSRWR